jgi:hypothetical protein
MLARMPAEVTVMKDELREVLEQNRARHRDAFLAAQAAYRKRVIEELDRRLMDARAGRHINLAFGMPVPEDHTGDYDREIRMLDMHTEDTVTISAHLFDQIVMDHWGWSASFNATNSVYAAS